MTADLWLLSGLGVVCLCFASVRSLDQRVSWVLSVGGASMCAAALGAGWVS